MADNYKEILEKVLSVTGKIGASETLKILDNIGEYGGGVAVLLSSIKANLNVSIRQIQEKNKHRTDSLYYAKRIFAYLLETELKYSRNDIAILMNKKNRITNEYITQLKEDIEGKTSFHKTFKNHLLDITNDLKNYLN